MNYKGILTHPIIRILIDDSVLDEQKMAFNTKSRDLLVDVLWHVHIHALMYISFSCHKL